MLYFKDLEDKVHCVDAGSTHLLPKVCTLISDEEVVILLAPTSAEQLEIDLVALKTTRDSALAGLTHDFGNGRVMQVRPSDAGNIQIAIALGVDQEWVMADNTVAIVTSTELQTAFDAGVQVAMVIWADYMTALKAL